ncbi:hypothetical protein U3516DRAFT_736187 [Neocallimastix sp. 'constans']
MNPYSKFNKYSGANNNSLVSIHGDDSSSFYVSIGNTNSKRIRSYNLAGAHNSEKGRYLD